MCQIIFAIRPIDFEKKILLSFLDILYFMGNNDFNKLEKG